MTAADSVDAVPPKALLDAVTAYFRPQKVILFGSHARGDAGPDSDYDLFVIVDDDAPAAALDWRSRHDARKSFRRAADIIVCRAAAFARKRTVIGALSHCVDREGVVVYERP